MRSNRRLLIFGTGGHARAVVSALESNDADFDLIFVSEDKSAPIDPYLANKAYDIVLQKDLKKAETRFKFAQVHIAIGENHVRKQCSIFALEMDLEPLTIIARSAVVDVSAKVGLGAFIAPLSFVGPNAAVGDFSILNSNSTVEHDSVVGRFAHVAPGACVLGGARIGEGGFAGANSVSMERSSLGAWSTLGALSFLNHSHFAEGDVLVGSPARAIRKPEENS